MTGRDQGHPDDVQHRQDLVALFRRLRLAAGLSYPQAATIHGSAKALSQWEYGDSADYSLATAQTRFRGIGHTLYPALRGLPCHDPTVETVIAETMARSPDPARADDGRRMLLLATIAAVRLTTGADPEVLGARIGVTAATYLDLEEGRWPSRVGSVQRLARAHGGYLRLCVPGATP